MPVIGHTSIGAKNIDLLVSLVKVRLPGRSGSLGRPFLPSGHPGTLERTWQGRGSGRASLSEQSLDSFSEGGRESRLDSRTCMCKSSDRAGASQRKGGWEISRPDHARLMPALRYCLSLQLQVTGRTSSFTSCVLGRGKELWVRHT